MEQHLRAFAERSWFVGFQTCPSLLMAKGLAGSLCQYRCVSCVKKFALPPDVKACLVREYTVDESSILVFEFYVEENKLLFQLVSGVLHYHDTSRQDALLTFAAFVHAQRVAKLVVCQRSIIHRDVEFLAAKVSVLSRSAIECAVEREGTECRHKRHSYRECSCNVIWYAIRRTHVVDDLLWFQPRCLVGDNFVSYNANVDSLKDWMRNIVQPMAMKGGDLQRLRCSQTTRHVFGVVEQCKLFGNTNVKKRFAACQ